MSAKKLCISIILSIIALINASYLTNLAYSQMNGSAFCDINATISCSTVFTHPASQIFGFPFPAIALVVYPILILFAVMGYYKRINYHRTAIKYISACGILFNAYMISQEIFVIKAFCPLCLICAAIIVTIHILSYGNNTSNT